MPPPHTHTLLWDNICEKRSRYSNRKVRIYVDTLIEQLQYSEKQCSKLLSYVCVAINKEI